MKKSLMIMFILVYLSFLTSGCVFVAGAAAGAAAIAVVHDHRTLENMWQDNKIANHVIARLNQNPALRFESHVEVTVFNHVVLLTGETPHAAWKIQAGNIAQSSPGVSRVYNQILIQGPVSTLTRTSDTWITTKIKSQMLTTENLKSGSIKVVTENGVVYLMGIVSKAQADVATDIARQVSGVQKVVRIFQYNK